MDDEMERRREVDLKKLATQASKLFNLPKWLYRSLVCFVLGAESPTCSRVASVIVHRSNALPKPDQKRELAGKVDEAAIIEFFERKREDWNNQPRPWAIEWLAKYSLKYGDLVQFHKLSEERYEDDIDDDEPWPWPPPPPPAPVPVVLVVNRTDFMKAVIKQQPSPQHVIVHKPPPLVVQQEQVQEEEIADFDEYIEYDEEEIVPLTPTTVQEQVETVVVVDDSNDNDYEYTEEEVRSPTPPQILEDGDDEDEYIEYEEVIEFVSGGEDNDCREYSVREEVVEQGSNESVIFLSSNHFRLG